MLIAVYSIIEKIISFLISGQFELIKRYYYWCVISVMQRGPSFRILMQKTASFWPKVGDLFTMTSLHSSAIFQTQILVKSSSWTTTSLIHLSLHNSHLLRTYVCVYVQCPASKNAHKMTGLYVKTRICRAYKNTYYLIVYQTFFGHLKIRIETNVVYRPITI